MKRLTLMFTLLFKLLFGLLFAALPAYAQNADADTEFRNKVSAFIDEWHDDAAHSRPSYFDKMAKDGVYIGTDKSERWTRDDFKHWAKRYFDRPSAWTFHPIKRNIAYTEDKSVIWFDEQLGTQMGVCQASGIIRNTKDGLRIEHYQLSLAVPNELVNHVTEEIKELDARQPAK
jgi:SnoaL-like domain